MRTSSRDTGSEMAGSTSPTAAQKREVIDPVTALSLWLPVSMMPPITSSGHSSIGRALSDRRYLNDRGLSARRASLICTVLGLCTAVGAITAVILLSGVGAAVLAFVLALGAAALLYLAVEELLVEAHEQTETTLLSAMFFAGFLAIYVLGELGG
jgi:hypothetical protein